MAIYSDSLSALKSLNSLLSKNQRVHNLITRIFSLRDSYNITLNFIRSHTDITGNDLADKLANKARLLDDITQVPLSKRYMRTVLTREAHQRLQEEWDSINSESDAKLWIPYIRDYTFVFPTNHYLTQLITGHGAFPAYFKRFNLRSDCQCPCGMEGADYLHYLTNCPLMTEYTIQLRSAIKAPVRKETLKTLLLNSRARQVLGEIGKCVSKLNDRRILQDNGGDVAND